MKSTNMRVPSVKVPKVSVPNVRMGGSAISSTMSTQTGTGRLGQNAGSVVSSIETDSGEMLSVVESEANSIYSQIKSSSSFDFDVDEVVPSEIPSVSPKEMRAKVAAHNALKHISSDLDANKIYEAGNSLAASMMAAAEALAAIFTP